MHLVLSILNRYCSDKIYFETPNNLVYPKFQSIAYPKFQTSKKNISTPVSKVKEFTLGKRLDKSRDRINNVRYPTENQLVCLGKNLQLSD